MSTSRGARPPAFVMNPYYSGLGIARCLHPYGVDVVALTWERGTPGARSRYFSDVVVVPNGRDEPERLCARLLEIAATRDDRPVLFPTRDFDVTFLNDFGDRLSATYRLPRPGHPSTVRLMDKLELANTARELNIATPATACCSSGQELEAALAALRFPIVMKPRFAYEWRRKDVWQRVGAQKAFIVHSSDEARALHARLASVADAILVQQYVAGIDRDIVVCCCYVDQRGEWSGHFTARKLRQSPPLTGTGSVVEAIDIPAIIAPSAALLKAFDYRGVAEIEFKHDVATDRYFLIEVNPRHWDQHELGTLIGTNISWLAYADLAGVQPARCTPRYEPSMRYKWVAEPEFVRALARELYTGVAATRGEPTRARAIAAVVRRTFADAIDLLRGRKIFALARLGDPIPGIATAWQMLRELARAIARRRRGFERLPPREKAR